MAIDLDNFPLPEIASQQLKAQIASGKRQIVEVADGVQIDTAGHDAGNSYRFFYHEEHNKRKSEIAGFEVCDLIEMIQWDVDRRHKPVERVHFLPVELLQFRAGEPVVAGHNPDGSPIFKPGPLECVGGKYADSYRRWKAGLTHTGTTLEKWGILEREEIFTLKHEGIYTVEQFAAKSDNYMKSKFGKHSNFMEAFDRAKQYVAGREIRANTDRLTDELILVKEEAAKRDAEHRAQMEAMQQQLNALLQAQAPEKKKQGRPRKVKQEEEANV